MRFNTLSMRVRIFPYGPGPPIPVRWDSSCDLCNCTINRGCWISRSSAMKCFHTVMLICGAVGLTGLSSCHPSTTRSASPSPVSIAPSPTPTVEQITARTQASFERAIFYKPREDSMTGLEMTFAPLLVQEVAVGDAPGAPGFGAAVAIDQSRARIDSEKPTLYATTVTTAIDGVDREQVVYVWRYPAPTGGERCISCEGRGVRITLGQDGLPLVWEALSTDTRTRVLFIAESLEQAARREFGEPLPGRRFSIERAADEAPDVVVARIIDDGPVPMGPYVYLNAPPSRAVTTVLCRCSPSQVEAFIETRYYDLRPLETFDPSGGGLMRWAVGWPGSFGPGGVDDLRSSSCPRSSSPPPPKEVGHPSVTGKSLDCILRWPKM